MSKRAVCLIVTIFLTVSVFAQENKNLQDTFLEAEYFLMHEDYPDALAYYLQLYEKMPDNSNLAYNIGVCYLNIPGKKNLSVDHKKMLDKLIDDHVQARKLMAKLAEANKKYVKGNADAGNDIIAYLKTLTVLYRKHIELEDKHFFIPSLGYFTKDEMNSMLSDMWEYDRTMIHIKYREVVGQAKEMISR